MLQPDVREDPDLHDSKSLNMTANQGEGKTQKERQTRMNSYGCSLPLLSAIPSCWGCWSIISAACWRSLLLWNPRQFRIGMSHRSSHLREPSCMTLVRRKLDRPYAHHIVPPLRWRVGPQTWMPCAKSWLFWVDTQRFDRAEWSPRSTRIGLHCEPQGASLLAGERTCWGIWLTRKRALSWVYSWSAELVHLPSSWIMSCNSMPAALSIGPLIRGGKAMHGRATWARSLQVSPGLLDDHVYPFNEGLLWSNQPVHRREQREGCPSWDGLRGEASGAQVHAAHTHTYHVLWPRTYMRQLVDAKDAMLDQCRSKTLESCTAECSCSTNPL